MLLTLPGTVTGCGNDGLVVRLAATGGKQDLPGLSAQAGSYPLTGILQRLFCLLSHRMETGGVSVNFFHVRQHGLDGKLAHLGGRCVICIDLHKITPNLFT